MTDRRAGQFDGLQRRGRVRVEPIGAGPVTLHLPLGRAAGREPGDLVLITPEDAGWARCGVRVVRLAPGAARSLRTGDSEMFVLPLAGSARVEVSRAGSEVLEATFELAGRASVFTRVSDFAYLGRDSEVVLSSRHGAEIALPSARCTTRLPARYGPAQGVPVDVRGAGAASRQVTNFGVPGVWDHAEKLMCCELITPGGNWSSYPPHKHDASGPCQVVNEEIYLYRIAGADQVTPSRAGAGFHRTYTGPEHDAAGLPPVDLFAEVRDLDVVLVPHGYHGPCAAAPGYPMYYLNVLAGPGAERSMAFCDDPAHTWTRGTWPATATDPRVPATSAAGRVEHSPAGARPPGR
ncbi:MAG TPA: 5-deoxy-glucuronate isomerase [Kineosporiaceae bacterium]